MHDSKNVYSHYDYIKQISLAWINPELHWPKKIAQQKKKRKHEVEQVTRSSRKKLVDSDMASASSTSSKCIKVNDSSLHPTLGKLNTRLNTSVQHLPEASKA